MKRDGSSAAGELLAEASRYGVGIALASGDLALSAPAPPPAEFLARLHAAKPEVIGKRCSAPTCPRAA